MGWNDILHIIRWPGVLNFNQMLLWLFIAMARVVDLRVWEPAALTDSALHIPLLSPMPRCQAGAPWSSQPPPPPEQRKEQRKGSIMIMEKWARTFSRTQYRTTSLGRPRAALLSFRPLLLCHLFRSRRSRHSSRRSAPDLCISQNLQCCLCYSLIP